MHRPLLPLLLLTTLLRPLVAAPPATAPAPGSLLPGGPAKWTLAWSDEFDTTDADLDKRWDFQNGPSPHILCSRWRDNARLANGTLQLVNRKQQRAGQNWTSASLWTRQQFQYGYFECRYRYAAATGTNNSFWLMTQGPDPASGKRYEIDINEGHFPASVNTNIHNHSHVTVTNGKSSHPTSSKAFRFDPRPDFSQTLETPISTSALRLSTRDPHGFHLAEFRAFAPSSHGYPKPLYPTADTDLPNLARDPATSLSASSDTPASPVANASDGNVATAWISPPHPPQWIQWTFPEPRTIAALQFINGTRDHDRWQDLLSNYSLQYLKDNAWTDLASFDTPDAGADFARDFHTFGLLWTESELAFYLDGKLLRRENNTFCHSPAPVFLSLAIIPWAGPITDAVDNTFMEVDYVRIYRPTP